MFITIKLKINQICLKALNKVTNRNSKESIVCTFNRMLNHSLKKMTIAGLLSLVSTGAVMQVQADEVIKPSAELTVESTSAVIHSININNASAQELADALNGVGLERAKAIVAWRQKNGQFLELNDLLKVKGIGKKILAANAEKIKL